MCGHSSVLIIAMKLLALFRNTSREKTNLTNLSTGKKMDEHFFGARKKKTRKNLKMSCLPIKKNNNNVIFAEDAKER